MAGLVRPRSYPIRQVTDDKQDAGMILNPRRMSHHGGLDATSKWPRGDSGFRDVEPPTKLKSAEISNRGTNE